jgi:GTPase SAR1 family protein
MKQKAYRLALLGLSGSGKTVILTALAQAHLGTAYPSASFTPPVDIQVTDKKEKKRYLDGAKRLEENLQLLERREMPYGTPFKDDLYYRFQFKDHHGGLTADLIDYAGELVNPRTTDEEDGKSQGPVKRLRRILSEVDGLLILLPVASPLEKERQDQNIAAIKATFEGIFQQRRAADNQRARYAPVAVLLNKWDVLGEIAYHSPATEQSKMQKFLAEPRGFAYKDLLRTLEYRLGEENVHVFPVSALGQSEERLSDSGERSYFPKEINPLHSFQLEEGFIWLMRRHQEITMERYSKDLQHAAAFPFFLNPFFIFNNKLFPLHEELKTYYRDGTEKANTVKAQRQRAVGLGVASVISLLCLVSGLGLSGEFLLDKTKLRALETAIAQPNPPSQAYENLANWLESYMNAPFYRHSVMRQRLSVSASKIAWEDSRRLQQVAYFNERNLAAEQAWQALASETDLQKRLALVEEFTASYQDLPVRYNEALALRSELLSKLEDILYGQTEIDAAPREVIALLDTHIIRYPSGRYTKDAEARRAALLLKIEQDDYKSAISAPSPEQIILALEKFLERHPEGNLRSQAASEINNQRRAIEKSVWEKVIAIQQPSERAEAANVYLQNYTNGQFAAQARQLIDEEAKRAEDDLWKAVSIAKTAGDIEKAARDYLIKYPLGKGRYSTQAEAAIQNARALDAFNREEARFRNAFSRGNYQAAAEQLEEWRKTAFSPELQARFSTLESEFNNSVQTAFWQRIENFMQKENFDKAEEELANFNRLPPRYKGQNDKAFVRNTQSSILQRQDQTLYARLLQSRTLEAAQAYLSQSRLGTMRSAVETFQRNLQAQTGVHTLTISYSIDFGSGNDNVAFSISVNGGTVVDRSFGKIQRGDSRSGSFSLSARLQDVLEISARARDSQSWVGTKDLGDGSTTVAVERLKNPVTINMITGDNQTNAVSLKISAGLPPEPTLPAYGP